MLKTALRQSLLINDKIEDNKEYRQIDKFSTSS